MSEETDRLLNCRELAEAISVSAPQITRWHQEGIIPAAIHEGRCIRFELSSVRAALAKRAKKKSPRSLA